MPELAQSSRLWSWMGRWHQALVFDRRVRVLSEALASQIPQQSSVLDIGCGDGTIASLISKQRADLKLHGVEVKVRPECKIPCTAFNGAALPFADATFDVCMLVDVLHHTRDVRVLLC